MKNSIKLYLINLLSILVLGTLLISCSSDNLNNTRDLERNEFVKKSSDTVDVEKIKELVTPFPDVYDSPNAKESMAKFVESISEFYIEEMTYEEFKHSLDPLHGLAYCKPEGDVLLQQGFYYIVNKVEPSKMSGKYIIDAFFAGISYYEESLPHVLDFNLIDDEEYDTIFSDLFGLDYNNTQTLGSNDDGCKWYQLGCHVKWLVNTIAEWWNTPAVGNGGMTNGQVIASIAAALGSVTGLVILLL